MDIAAPEVRIPDAMLAKVAAAHTQGQADEVAEYGPIVPYSPGEAGQGLTSAVRPATVGIVTTEGGEEYVPWRLIDGLKARGMQPVIVDPTTATRVGAGLIDTGDGVPIRLDAAFTRIVPTTGIDFVQGLENDHVPVVNGSGVHHVLTSKTAMRQQFRANGVPTVSGEHPVKSGVDLLRAAKRFSLPMVLKPDDGREGKGIVKIASRLQLWKQAASLQVQRGVDLLAEPFVTTRPDVPRQSDVRVVTVGDMPLAGFRRVPQDGEFRSNIAVGGKVASVELTDEHRAVALAAHRAIGLDVSGTDEYETVGADGTGSKIIVGEINRAPHLSDRDSPQRVSDAVAELIAKRYNASVAPTAS